MKVGLYFGSFNPIHNGHLAIANYIAEYSDLEQIWFMVSPQNPFKSKSSLLPDYHRYELVNRAIDDFPKFRVSNLESKLPQPSYTIDTLTYLHELYPQHAFSLIMGEDNLTNLHKWKNHHLIIDWYSIYVYRRPDSKKGPLSDLPSIRWVDAPQMEISSSFIRKAISEGKDVRFFMQKDAYLYLNEMNFYKPHKDSNKSKTE